MWVDSSYKCTHCKHVWTMARAHARVGVGLRPGTRRRPCRCCVCRRSRPARRLLHAAVWLGHLRNRSNFILLQTLSTLSGHGCHLCTGCCTHTSPSLPPRMPPPPPPPPPPSPPPPQSRLARRRRLLFRLLTAATSSPPAEPESTTHPCRGGRRMHHLFSMRDEGSPGAPADNDHSRGCRGQC